MCPQCQGHGVTTQTNVTIELDEHGNQVPRVHEFTASCGMCTGRGEVD